MPAPTAPITYPPQFTPDYNRGFEAGLQYATAAKRKAGLAADRKFFAAITLTVGLGTTAAAVATVTESKYRYAFAAFGIAGLLLGTIITTVRVLNGGPAPWEM